MKWHQIDAEAFAKSRLADQQLSALSDRSIALIAAGVDLGYPATLEHWETVAGMAAAQVENGLRTAWWCAFAGYPVQALTLARQLTEYTALMGYVRLYPEAATAWLDGTRESPLTAGAMLAKLLDSEPGASAGLNAIRKVLTELAHQNPVGLSALAYDVIGGGPQTPGQMTFTVGNLIDREKLRYVGSILLRLSGFALHLLCEWRSTADSEWRRDYISHSRSALKWLARYESEETRS